MKKLRTAVIGLGRIGWLYHVPQIAAAKGFELVCVCDSLEQRLSEAKQGYNVNVYQDVDEMLSREKIDLAVVASPTKFHLQHTMAAFKAGCDVFCEKPAMASSEEMRAVIEAMRAYRRKFMVYQPHRGGADVVCLKHILDSGVLGRVFMMRRTRCDYTRRNDWQAFKEFGGGMLNNYGSHCIDQMQYLAGSSFTKVYCAARKIVSLGNAEDVVRILLETADGVIIDIDINMAAALPVQPWMVFGQYGTASFEPQTNEWIARYCKAQELTDISATKELAAKDRSYLNGESIKWYEDRYDINNFKALDYYEYCYRYFAMNEQPLVSSEDTMKLMQTLHECRRQIETVN